MSTTQNIISLFGTHEADIDFTPLKPLGECEEEMLTPIIDGLLYEKTFALIHSPKDQYKSWLAAYMASCVALGKPCFGRKVKQGKVVYVYGEGAMKNRLKRICRGLGNENPADLFPYPLRADLTDDAELEELMKHIPEKTSLLVIDNFEKYWSSEMDEPVNKALKFLRYTRELTTPLLLLHDRKNNIRSTGQHVRALGQKLPNSADSSIAISRKSDIAICDLYLREDEPPPKFSFKLVDLENKAITCEEIQGLSNKEESEDDAEKACVEETAKCLRKHMEEPLGKTAIYKDVLNRQGIKGLKGQHFYNVIFPKLLEVKVLRPSKTGKDLYELVDK